MEAHTHKSRGCCVNRTCHRNVARMVEMCVNAYKMCVRELEGKRLIGKSRRRWEDSIRIDPKEMRCDDAHWVLLDQDLVRYLAVVYTAMLLWAL